MKIRRLVVKDFAAIRESDIEFGPGLNILYGPNDLGKSTLADAIRLALLLPHTSSHIEEFVPWAGGQNPRVELTFETEAQRIWRVKKEFRKGGASVLEESKNGVDFDEVERARKVDGRLRDLLRWGIPEPGGSGGSKGLPTSFLSTVLLSTQSDVTAILSESLQGDSTGTGKERIAAALQAVSQDPLFVALLNATQARRDEAYTEKGAKKTAKGTVFKVAADRINDARNEKEQLQRVVDDSEGVEKQLRELTGRRDQREAALIDATDRVKTFELLSTQAAALAVAEEQVRVASAEVERIRRIGADVEAAERTVTALGVEVNTAGEALQVAQGRLKDAETAFASATDAARAAGANSSTTGTVARQNLELRRVSAEQASRDAQQRIDEANAAQKLVESAEIADAEHRKQQAAAERARASLAVAAAGEQAVTEQLRRLDLLEGAVESLAADEAMIAAQTDMVKKASLQARLEAATLERDEIIRSRAAIAVPTLEALTPMRRLANDLAGARGALNVGLVVTVTPKRPVDIRVNKDGTPAETKSIAEPLEIEADAEVDVELADTAAVRIRGGRREAQQTMELLEQRWEREVTPHLAAANVKDLDALAAKVEEARTLDGSIVAKDAELESFRVQLESLAGSADLLREASEWATTARAALGDVSLDALTSDLATLGANPTDALRKQRQQLSTDVEAARAVAGQSGTNHTLAEERGRSSKAALDAAVVMRDAALAIFTGGVTVALSAARASLAAASEEQKKLATEVAALESTIAAEAVRIEAAVSGTRLAAEHARTAVESAQEAQKKAIAEHASELGRLEELRRQRNSQDLAGAENRLREAVERHAAVPVPERLVTDIEVTAARNAEAGARADLERVVSEIHKTHGALEQVGGAVARERLRDAIEASDVAERHEREIEAEYDAWLLLLQQMKEADAAQASNLGQVLAPAIAGKFVALTQKRYENVRLTAQLGTEGIVVGGAVRPSERFSVGTREQLSTLYRLCLAEYLGTTVVLDDQLVQSDDKRMHWFRDLLVEKAALFQIIVFTCRPEDYLEASASLPKGKAVHRDTDDGIIRAISLERLVHRR
jgi:DNA repair exonuclease SbcCD ATPase subunit